MDVEPGMLLKLRRLENKLTELVDKIDKEIIQTDVEWMHLKNVVETTAKVSDCKTEPKSGSKPVLFVVCVPFAGVILDGDWPEWSCHLPENSILHYTIVYIKKKKTRDFIISDFFYY
ncbi:unnamed protein product, partial [Callosobruchus maculatus]